MSVIRNLTTMKRKALHLLGAVSVVAIILPATSSPAWAQSELAESKGAQAAPIEGTWILTIHRVNQGITFSALQSFTAGGVTLATGTVDRTPPPPISPLFRSREGGGGNPPAGPPFLFFFFPGGDVVG